MPATAVIKHDTLLLVACPLLWAVGLAAPIPAKLIEVQGCSDCSQFGERLVEKGFKQGLGRLIELEVVHIGDIWGSEQDPTLKRWVACASHLLKSSDPEYRWFQVAACANRGHITVAQCAEHAQLPAVQRQQLDECVASHGHQLLQMAISKIPSVHSVPWMSVGNQVFADIDQTGNDVAPILNEACVQAKQQGMRELPAVCTSGQVPKSAHSSGHRRGGSGCGSFLAIDCQHHYTAGGK